MKSSRNVNAYDALIYCIVMLVSNLIATASMMLILSVVRGIVSESVLQTLISHPIATSFGVTIIAVCIECLGKGLYFYRKIPDIVTHRDGTTFSLPEILRNACFLILPGEILRLLASMIFSSPGRMFGYRFVDGIFAIAPNFLCDQLYLTPNNRMTSIRKYGYTISDHLHFLGIYLPYLMIVLVAAFLLFYWMWRRNERDYAQEVKIRMDPSQIK